MGELVNRGESAIVPEGFYKQVSSILNAARDKAYTAVNFAMVEAYWEIGKSIVDEQGGEERAAYGEALIAGLSRRLTADFGRGFGIANLRNMRQFFLAFPIRDALRSELSWTHYRRRQSAHRHRALRGQKRFNRRVHAARRQRPSVCRQIPAVSSKQGRAGARAECRVPRHQRSD